MKCAVCQMMKYLIVKQKVQNMTSLIAKLKVIKITNLMVNLLPVCYTVTELPP